jgi:hypothetical protein
LPGGCGIRFFTTENLVHYLLKERKIQMNVKTFESLILCLWNKKKRNADVMLATVYLNACGKLFCCVIA